MRRRHLESVSAALYGRCFASFVSSRSLSVRGSWGTAPSVFWFLLYAQKERPGGEPYRPSPFGDFVTPLGDYNLSPPGRRTGLAPCKINAPPLGDYNLDLKILLLLFFTEKERPRWVGVLPKPCKRPLPPRQAITNPPQNIIINPSKLSPNKSTSYINLAHQSPIL